MKRVISSIFILVIGCASIQEPNNDQTALLIGQIIYNGSGFESDFFLLNTTYKNSIEVTILNKETNSSTILKTDSDGIFSLGNLPSGEYLFKKLKLTAGSRDSNMALSSMSFGNVQSFSVIEGKVNNVGIINWKHNPDNIKYFLNKEYNEVYNYFSLNYPNSKWLKREWIKVKVNVNSAMPEFKSVSAEKEEFNKALEDSNKLIEMNPKSAFAYNNKGFLYYNRKKYDEAISVFTRAIELDPKYKLAYSNRGLCYCNKNEYDKAIEDCNKAIELDPEYKQAYNNRGLSYSGKKEFDKAIADYNKAIELDPKYNVAYNNRANLNRKKKNYDKAMSDYNKAIELDPKYVRTYNDRGYAYYLKKEYSKARLDIDKAIELDPKYILAYSYRGELELRLRNFDNALKDFEIALKLDENKNYTYICFMLYYWNAKRDLTKSLELLESAFQKGFKNVDTLYDEEDEGFFLKDVNQTKEFKQIVQKYNKIK
jgi:tetratricopeptide (TPR) repeat protein